MRVDPSEVNQIDTDDFIVTKDNQTIYQTILEVLKKYGVMAIQDDYPSWKASNFDNN